MQYNQVMLFLVYCWLSLVASTSHAQISEPIDQILFEALTKYRLNLGLILDRSVIQNSSTRQIILRNPTNTSACLKQTQTIQMIQEVSVNSLSQSLIFDDCNFNKAVFTIIQNKENAIELTLNDWINGRWKFSEMKFFKLQLSHKKLFIEKNFIVRDSGVWLQFHFDYTDLPDAEIPTDTARLNFEELKTEKHLRRNYLIDVGQRSPSINLGFRSTTIGPQNSKDFFVHPFFSDEFGEVSPKYFASQYQSYLTNIVFKSVQNAIGLVPLVLPSL